MNALLIRLGLRFADPPEEAAFFAAYCSRNLAFVRAMLLFGGALLVGFVAWDRVIDPIGAERTFWVRLLLTGPAAWGAALALFFPRLLRFVEPIVTLASSIAAASIAAICAMLSGGIDVAAGGINLVVLFVCALIPARLPWYALFCLATAIAYAVAQSFAGLYRPGMPLINALMLVTAMGMGGIAVASRELAARRQFRTTAALVASSERVEELLHSILPRAIVRRLQQGETVIADLHGEVSIVFADIVGFTDLSRRLSATELVAVLNRLFSAFDRAAEAQGMQKIKTIGDAYMAVGGLADEDAASPAAVEFAFALHRAARAVSAELGMVLALRIGLHVGPVVAGVIGTSRPAFDCWGEAVNLAARLESSARAGDILLSERADTVLRATLGERYRSEPLPAVALKGIGATSVFRLVEAA